MGEIHPKLVRERYIYGRVWGYPLKGDINLPERSSSQA